MISLINNIPEIKLPRAEVVKINCTYNSYKDIALFWIQNKTDAIISMLDGNMVIYNNNADIQELREFVSIISPASVFSDESTMASLFENDFHKVCVVQSEYNFDCDLPSQTVNSNEMYTLLNINGLDLPPYEYFAVDFCLRLNHGELKYFALKDKCAAIGVYDGNAVLVNGIASHQKGMGSIALNGLLSQYDCCAIAVCENEVMPFYLKNNFNLAYYAGYWRKSLELF